MVAGIISAPVIVALFGGITGSGPSVVVAYLLASGKKLLGAVFLSGLASEPLDKTLQVLMAAWIYRSLPKRIVNTFEQRPIVVRRADK